MERYGYYSVVQFLPDVSRFETVNIGVVLLTPTGRVVARLANSNNRIKQVFGKQDWSHLSFLKRSLEKRLSRERFTNPKDFSDFAAKRANLLQMTSPKPISVDDESTALDRLFFELVTPVTSFRRRRIDVFLGEKLQIAGVRSLVEHSVKVRFPFFDQPFRAPYAYQNGRYNLLTAVQFNVDLKEMISKVAEKALEGRVLFENPDPNHGMMALNVIGQFPEELEEDSRRFVEGLFQESHVKLYDFEDLDPLLQDIRQASADHTSAS